VSSWTCCSGSPGAAVVPGPRPASTSFWPGNRPAAWTRPGKEQGYLTYAEVNDHLPDDIVDPEQIEDIITMINDMGIEVHEIAPDADTLLLTGTAVTTDDDAAEEAAAALASVDSEFGRTTDPVRMYMREMGTVELLTREGEIEIAKRIEDGLGQVLSALPTTPPPPACCSRSTRGWRPARRAWPMSSPASWTRTSTKPVPAARRRATADTTAARTATMTTTTMTTTRRSTPVDTGPDPEEAARASMELRKRHEKVEAAIAGKGKPSPARVKAARRTVRGAVHASS
jgi:RNA polymerase primary sigma factor